MSRAYKVLQHEGDEERDGVIYSVTCATPVRVLALRAGTLPRLVLHLLDARVLGDITYIPAFLATYRTFTNTRKVLRTLLDRLEDDDYTQATSNSYGGKDDDVSGLFCGWMSQYPDDFILLDQDLREELSRCFVSLKKVNLVTKLQEVTVRERPVTAAGASLEEDDHYDPLDVLTFQAGYVAEQLTCLEASSHTSAWGLCGLEETGEETTVTDATLSERPSATLNRLSGAVTSSCVQDPQLKPQQRARVIEKWVRVAEECWNLRNFSSVYAILSALQSTSVHRLKRVWAETSREIQRSYQEMSEVFSEKDNYARMRELLFQGVIPYLGVFLTDLVMLDSAIRDQLENGYLNFEKRRKEFESLSQIRILQTVCLGYRFTPDPHFAGWFQKLRLISEEESYRLSCDIESNQDPTVTTPPNTVKPTVIITHCTELLASIAAPFGPGMHLVSWDTPCERLMTPGLSAQQKSPSVPALDTQSSPKPAHQGFLTPAVMVRTHRRSASCGSPLNIGVQHGASSESITEQGKFPDSTADFRIIRARVEPAAENSVYKSVRISSQEKAPTVIDRIIRKHHGILQGPQELVQLLPGNKELLIPGTANVFYAMSAASLDFLVRPHLPAAAPQPETRHHLKAQVHATYPKIKAKAGDFAKSLF
ncbi:unnamed protein product [Ranitomeya imitator]|uniref:Ral guanine nucleotide dissociation stimulator-like 2 n=1 Tax=Ranitomeya imitator TaxID=111125 RepID=A0ABN9LN11_9NEOB|nr:unnamed protein product [Ranitomeya imitator]